MRHKKKVITLKLRRAVNRFGTCIILDHLPESA